MRSEDIRRRRTQELARDVIASAACLIMFRVINYLPSRLFRLINILLLISKKSVKLTAAFLAVLPSKALTYYLSIAVVHILETIILLSNLIYCFFALILWSVIFGFKHYRAIMPELKQNLTYNP